MVVTDCAAEVAMPRAVLFGVVALFVSTAIAAKPSPAATAPGEGFVKCVSVQPICPPGTHPMCVCESDYSYNCQWICAGQ